MLYKYRNKMLNGFVYATVLELIYKYLGRLCFKRTNILKIMMKYQLEH